MKKIIGIIDKTEEFILIILMFMMTIAIVTQVFSRTVLLHSLAWTEEVGRFLLVWITYVGASLGVKRGAHIGVEAVQMFLPYNIRKVVIYMVFIISATFTGIVFFESTKILLNQLESKQVSAGVQIPMWLPYLGVTFGTFLMTFRFIEKLVESIKGHKLGGEIK